VTLQFGSELIFPLRAAAKQMLTEEPNLEFVRRAAAELAVSYTDPRDHNLHAAINGLIEAIESDRTRLRALEEQLRARQKKKATGGSSAFP
jgi:hypothetical protein